MFLGDQAKEAGATGKGGVAPVMCTDAENKHWPNEFAEYNNVLNLFKKAFLNYYLRVRKK